MGTTGLHIPGIVPISLSLGLSSSPHFLAHHISATQFLQAQMLKETDCYFHFFLQTDNICIYIYHALAGAYMCSQQQNNQSFSVISTHKTSDGLAPLLLLLLLSPNAAC